MTVVVSPWFVQFSILFLVPLPFNLQYTDKGNKISFAHKKDCVRPFIVIVVIMMLLCATAWNDCYWSFTGRSTHGTSQSRSVSFSAGHSKRNRGREGSKRMTRLSIPIPNSSKKTF